MEISHAQRLILSNQYRLMAMLDPAQKAHYDRCRHVIEQGYELQIRELDHHFSHLPETLCQQVLDILEMHHALGESYHQLSATDKSQLAEHRIQFHGFDGKTEKPLQKYVQFLIEEEGHYRQFQRDDHDYNTNLAMLEKYQRMNRVWQTCPRQYHLSLTEILNVLAA